MRTILHCERTLVQTVFMVLKTLGVVLKPAGGVSPRTIRRTALFLVIFFAANVGPITKDCAVECRAKSQSDP